MQFSEARRVLGAGVGGQEMMYRSISAALVCAISVLWAMPARPAECPQDIPQRYCDHPWFAANRLSLEMSDERRKFSADWTFEIADNNDLRVYKRETASGDTVQGEVMIVGGERMLVRGFSVPEGNELGAIDGPALAMQLALRLLEFAIPAGPDGVNPSTAIEYRSERKDLALATPSADGGFPAPWSVRGTAQRLGDRAVGFDMVFESAVRSEQGLVPYKIPMKGTWRRVSPSPRFDDSMSLEDWSIHRVSVLSREDVRSYATLGELRAALAGPR